MQQTIKVGRVLIALSLFAGSVLQAATFTVTSTADSGAGSLRQAFISAAAQAGADTISFSLPAGSIVILFSEIVVSDTQGVTVDAVSSGGVILFGAGGRHFYMDQYSKLTLRGLYLIGGNGAGAGGALNGHGGAIFNRSGTLLVDYCTFAFNTAVSGGAIFSNTDSINTVGGPISNTALTNCTLFSNTASYRAGGIFNENGITSLTHCTINSNNAPTASGGGLASYGDNLTRTYVKNSIIAGNSGGDVDIFSGSVNSFYSWGGNLIGNGNATGNFNQSGDSINHTSATLKLGPFFNYGGPAPTLRPLPGSPAIDAAGSGTTIDQRGRPRAVDGDGVGGAAADIGAVELQRVVVNTMADENNFPAGANISLREAVRDSADLVNFALSANDTMALSLGTALLPPTPGWVIIDTGATNGLTIDGGPGDNRIFTVNSGTGLTLRGLTLTGGNGDAPAGGFGARGGAVSNESGNLLIDRCTLTGNTADDGGAIYSNTAPITGSISSSTTLTNCTIAGNTLVNGSGSAIRNINGRTRLTHCTVSDNTAPFSSAVSSAGDIDTETSISNSIIAGNVGNDADFSSGGVNSFTSGGHNLIGIGNSTGNFNQSGDLVNQTAESIRLERFDDYGGLTKTLLPQIGSPALDAAEVVPGMDTDGRGFSRNLDGDGVGGALPDIGAVEVRTTFVTTAADEGDNPAGAQLSLREAIRDANGSSDVITFVPGFTGPINLTARLIVPTNTSVIVDASLLNPGLTLDALSGDTRHFGVSGAGVRLTLRGLTFVGGTGHGFPSGFGGGSIYFSGGTLLVDRCTFTGNSSDNFGGAIEARTPVATDTITLSHCTLTGNTGGSFAGGIIGIGNVALIHCTITDNTSPIGTGGGVYGDTNTVHNCIIAGNTGGDVEPVNAFTSQGGNLIGSGAGSSAFNQAGDSTGHTTASIKLAPLGDYGGPARTMALAAGSPARNSATGPPPTSDQRGFPIVGIADIGAYEAGTFTNYNAYIYEYLPATASVAEHASSFDFDGDGETNGAEFLVLSDPFVSSAFAATIVRSGGNVVISFNTTIGMVYRLWRSDTLLEGSWTNTGLTDIYGDGSERSFTLAAPTPGVPKRFFYVESVFAGE